MATRITISLTPGGEVEISHQWPFWLERGVRYPLHSDTLLRVGPANVRRTRALVKFFHA